MQRIPQWLLVTLWAATLACFFVAAIPALRADVVDVGQTLARFIAPTILLVICILANTFDTIMNVMGNADVQTWIFLGSILVTGVLFIGSFVIKEADASSALRTAACSVGAFAVGLKVGGQLEKDDEAPRIAEPTSAPTITQTATNRRNPKGKR